MASICPQIYTNPDTQSQLRGVLQGINSGFGDISGAIGTLEAAFADTGIASATITLGDVVYTPSAGAVNVADASSITTAVAIGIATGNAASTESVTIQTGGIFENPLWTLTPGARYFLSGATAGALVAAPDQTAAGNVAIVIGYAMSATELNINIAPPIVY